jgi:hypothetical protein
MGEMEWSLLSSYKEEHAAITAAMSDFERIGYLVSGISYKNGALEVTCQPPVEKEDEDRKLREALEADYGTEDSGLSMDGVSESFKP